MRAQEGARLQNGRVEGLGLRVWGRGATHLASSVWDMKCTNNMGFDQPQTLKTQGAMDNVK